MKGVDVVNQLRAILPKLTDLFTDTLAMDAMVRVSTTVTVTTTLDHGLSIGRFVNISGVQIRIPLSEITQLDNIATATVADPLKHDLSVAEIEDIIIEGATESEYNGTKTLLSTPNRKVFTYQIADDPTSPATGSPDLIQNGLFGSYNGRFAITAIPSANQFEYEIIQDPVGDPVINNASLRVRARISGAIEPERFEARYTKQLKDKFWISVIPENEFVSKNRNILTDANDTVTSGMDPRIRMIEPFSIYLYAPLPNIDSGLVLLDSMKDIRTILLQAIMGFTFPTGLKLKPFMQAYYIGSEFVDYNNAYLTYRFNFETTTDITVEDIFEPDTIALSRIQGEINDFIEFDVDFTQPET